MALITSWSTRKGCSTFKQKMDTHMFRFEVEMHLRRESEWGSVGDENLAGVGVESIK